MQVRLATDYRRWDEWLIAQTKYSPFAQSSAWGDILIAEGRKRVERLEIWDGEACLAEAQCVFTDLPFGLRYAFCAKGPVMSKKTSEREIYKAILEYLKKENCIFFRIEPASLLRNADFEVRKSIDIQPRATSRLDLNKTDDELLALMHHKARYNIRLAEKKGVTIKEGKDSDAFLRLYHETSKRDGFTLHDDDRYRVVLNSKAAVYQLSAVFEDKIVATGIFLGFGNAFYYLYGASDYYYRHVMSPYLVQWSAIRLARKLGYKYYDFYGIAPPPGEKNLVGSALATSYQPVEGYVYDEKHQHGNLARFKMGFGGEIEYNIGTWDVVIDRRKYWVYKIVRALRRLI